MRSKSDHSMRRVIPIVPAGAARDSSAVVSLYQAESRIYPRAVSGWFSHWRWAMVWITQLVFYGLPWLTINERQAMLFDLVARRLDPASAASAVLARGAIEPAQAARADAT